MLAISAYSIDVAPLSSLAKSRRQEGSIAGITPGHAERLQRRLDALNQATRAEDLNVPGFNFHKLRGRPPRWSIHVNGPWCVTFEWQGED
ncbi:MAG: type II toxin-antitoxin system RelE/ParE family toxin, partial [Hyphomicrobium denitrificans]|nr:type II toxin-antitoxin system RelE/ParE family toxin [Hyphomicrobium denitrificans]